MTRERSAAGRPCLGTALAILICTGVCVAADETAPAINRQMEASSTVFYELLKDAGLNEMFRDRGPYTVFAPSDAAFRAIGESELNSLRGPGGRDRLRQLLLAHIVRGEFTRAQIGERSFLLAISGDPITLKPTSYTLRLGDLAAPAKWDIPAEFGVVHELDRVLTPAAPVALLPPADASAAMQPDDNAQAEVALTRHVYKHTSRGDLYIDVYSLPRAPAARPAALLIPGGGWEQTYIWGLEGQCRYLARRGMVAATISYRCRRTHDANAVDATEDGFDAIRWMRQNAAALGIDAEKLVLGGGSAGGHMALMAALTPARDGRHELMPAAVIAFNPSPDATRPAYRSEKFAGQAEQLSPLHNVRRIPAPVLIFHGAADDIVPLAWVEQFTREMRDAGNDCRLVVFAGMPHGFFNTGRFDNVPFAQTMQRTDEFLCELGLLEPLVRTSP